MGNQVRPHVDYVFDRRRVEGSQDLELSRTNGRGLDLISAPSRANDGPARYEQFVRLPRHDHREARRGLRFLWRPLFLPSVTMRSTPAKKTVGTPEVRNDAWHSGL